MVLMERHSAGGINFKDITIWRHTIEVAYVFGGLIGGSGRKPCHGLSCHENFSVVPSKIARSPSGRQLCGWKMDTASQNTSTAFTIESLVGRSGDIVCMMITGQSVVGGVFGFDYFDTKYNLPGPRLYKLWMIMNPWSFIWDFVALMEPCLLPRTGEKFFGSEILVINPTSK